MLCSTSLISLCVPPQTWVGRASNKEKTVVTDEQLTETSFIRRISSREVLYPLEKGHFRQNCPLLGTKNGTSGARI